MDIYAFNYDLTFKEVLNNIVNNTYSRVPIYKDNIDEITGMLYVKDLLPYLHLNNFEWTSILRKPFFIPENKKLDDLMQDFQYKKIHLAIVVGEYGGTSGIIALEDVIEEIVGDISDEFDDDNLSFSKLDNNNYIFEGKTPMKDFYKVLNIDCLLYTSPSPRDRQKSRMPSSA